jgi:hypothetical protein
MSPELVPVDRDGSDAAAATVLDLVSDQLTPAVLERTAPQPLVVVDGLVVGHGLDLLERIPATFAESVRYLRTLEAVRLYGPQAASGAILVKLKSSG